jgi:hypothetical protein
MRRRRALPLSVPVPFRTPSSAIATRDALIGVLTVVDALHDIAKPEHGTVVAGAIGDLVAVAEPRAPRLVIDLELSIAVGFAIRRFETLGMRSERDDTVATSTWDVISWAAMEQAGGAPERHVPWIAYGVLAGYFISRHGRAAMTAVRDELEVWIRARGRVTHSAHWEGRLVADFGIDSTDRMTAYSYLPLRPSGPERMHDQLLFDAAWDDYAESLGRGRPNGTPRLDAMFPLAWEPPIS